MKPGFINVWTLFFELRLKLVSEQNRRRGIGGNKGRWHNIYLPALGAVVAATTQTRILYTRRNWTTPSCHSRQSSLSDSDNTTIVMTKDYINCERTYFIVFDDECLVHADSRQRSTMLPPLKWIFIFTFKTITLLNIQMLQQDSTRTNACAISCIHISYNIINSSPGPF